MNALALDIGTTTGWAIWDDGQVLSGSWLLATEKQLRQQRKVGGERRGDIRFFQLRDRIADAIARHRIEVLVFEDVQFATSAAQTQLWASLRSAVWLAGKAVRHVECVHTGTLKKFATGAGNAGKEQMVAAAANLARPWGRVVVDDNEADALHILRWWHSQNAEVGAKAVLVPSA
ncbi:hypothetical protein DB346_08225 [Verrucomicrobia bacterium LW23]|nr:hypothetical protein DB346_08225 [Verrucomicrobia bacterium LW23]